MEYKEFQKLVGKIAKENNIDIKKYTQKQGFWSKLAEGIGPGDTASYLFGIGLFLMFVILIAIFYKLKII
jgi:hypothetical protein